MNETMEKQEQYTRTDSAFYGADRAYAGRTYERTDRMQSAPAQTYTPGYGAGNYGYDGYGYNNGYYDASGAQNAGYYDAYRASYDNRYNYEDPRHYEQQDLVPVQEGGFPEYGINKNGGKPKKKMRLNTKAKILIALYFAIIAVVATLILVNVVIGGSAAEATTEPSAYTQDATAYFVGADGSASALQAGEGASYAYDTQTNSFDEFCDWLGEQVG